MSPTRSPAVKGIEIFLVILLRLVDVGAHTTFTNKDLRTAVVAWNSDLSSAEAAYGAISGWNMSCVTDMSSVFSGAEAFDENISG